jgi:hypothetical protein
MWTAVYRSEMAQCGPEDKPGRFTRGELERAEKMASGSTRLVPLPGERRTTIRRARKTLLASANTALDRVAHLNLTPLVGKSQVLRENLLSFTVLSQVAVRRVSFVPAVVHENLRRAHEVVVARDPKNEIEVLG